MKKIAVILFFTSVLLSCEKLSDLKVTEVIPGGCNLESKASLVKGDAEDINQVKYSITDGHLNMFVGFNATCCGKFSTSSEIESDSILIEIKSIQIGACDCICYYTFNFIFSGTGAKYTYKVTVDDNLTFYGDIRN